VTAKKTIITGDLRAMLILFENSDFYRREKVEKLKYDRYISSKQFHFAKTDLYCLKDFDI